MQASVPSTPAIHRLGECLREGLGTMADLAGLAGLLGLVLGWLAVLAAVQ